MFKLQNLNALLGILFLGVAILLGFNQDQSIPARLFCLFVVFFGTGVAFINFKRNLLVGWLLIMLVWWESYYLFQATERGVGLGSEGFALIGLFFLAWAAMNLLSQKYNRDFDLSPHHANFLATFAKISEFSVTIIFGIGLMYHWELLIFAYDVPAVLLPPPSMIFTRFIGSGEILWADFVQTFVKAVIIGYIIGNSAGFLTAIIADRIPFLKRGLLPLGNFVSALPIIGIAPIMVMWFGFDWQSKVAVVVIMTFFPMMVNTLSGLSATGRIEHELMISYGASYWQSLFKLRLPFSMPFIFNGLKLNSTLALIGAIVAEFFGTPIVGIGFRISTEVGRMNVDMVWAEILMAAIIGSTFYFLIALCEKKVTFWHPSFRHKR